MPNHAIYVPLGTKTPIWKPEWQSMLSIVHGTFAPVSWEDLDPATVQEIPRESSGYTLDILKDGVRHGDGVETTPGEDKYPCWRLLPPTPPAMYLILMSSQTARYLSYPAQYILMMKPTMTPSASRLAWGKGRTPSTLRRRSPYSP